MPSVTKAETNLQVIQAGQPMDLHRFWDGVITLRNDSTTLQNRQEFQREKRGEEKPKFTPPANQTVPCRRSPNQPPSKPAMNGTRPTARRFTTVKLPEIRSAISTAKIPLRVLDFDK
jgi:hypothetical protein